MLESYRKKYPEFYDSFHDGFLEGKTLTEIFDSIQRRVLEIQKDIEEEKGG
jgi:hypothetical protein